MSDAARARAIEAMLSKQGRSIKWLAEQIGESRQKVHAWLRGDYAPRDPAVWDRMRAALQAGSAGRPDKTSAVDAYRAGTRWVPVYAGLSAGPPDSHHGDVEWIELMDWGTHFERWGRKIDGFSMEPLLRAGDVVVFEDRRPEHSHVVHAYKSGDDTCKVLWGRGPSAELRPVNPDYDALAIEGWNVKGVAIMVVRRGPDDERITIEYPYGLRHRFG